MSRLGRLGVLLKRALRCSRGSAHAETLLALPPIFIFFSSIVQFSYLATADLVLKHSTVAGVRAAIVIAGGPESNPGANGPETDIVNAVALAMGPWMEGGAFENVRVDWTSAATRADPVGRIALRVRGNYRCRVPIANALVCRGTRRPLSFTVALPQQGAQYKL